MLETPSLRVQHDHVAIRVDPVGHFYLARDHKLVRFFFVYFRLNLILEAGAVDQCQGPLQITLAADRFAGHLVVLRLKGVQVLIEGEPLELLDLDVLNLVLDAVVGLCGAVAHLVELTFVFVNKLAHVIVILKQVSRPQGDR